MSTPHFRMKSVTAWSDLLTVEEGVLAPESVERLEAAYQRVQRMAAALPFTYDPLWLLTGQRPEGWEYLTGALRPGRDLAAQYLDRLHAVQALSPPAAQLATELDHLVGERLAELEGQLVLFMRALLETRQTERPPRRGFWGWLRRFTGAGNSQERTFTADRRGGIWRVSPVFLPRKLTVLGRTSRGELPQQGGPRPTDLGFCHRGRR